jgi:Tfp pilus assembly protein PilF
MSLLLEALKKAEKAKEDAQRRGRDDAPAPPSPAAQPAAAQEARPALEIMAEEPPKPQETALDFVEEKPRAAPKAEPAAAADRATARKVFEAKFKEPNPRLPFYITVGALGVFAVGTVVYFWMQLRPPAPLVNLTPQPSAGAQVAAAPEPRPTTSAPAAPLQPQGAIPGLPSASPPPSATPSPTPALAMAPAKPAARVAVERAPVRERPQLKPLPEIAATRAAPQVHPKVGSAYNAYLAGDLASARTDYHDALREEPANRDALLGLAALEVRAGRLQSAEATYVRLLHADPRDAHAHAALIALRTGRVDPVAAESRVKFMLADNPAAYVLNFTLGNQFAQQGRWAEAQQEYFRAFSAEPDNPDFAYNLAVSLDHLRQPSLALEYYRRAVALGKARGASFDAAAAEARIAQLSR